MHVSFNVLTDPWIPVVGLDGSRKLLGIRDTLTQASSLREISAPPLEEFSLYRFLCVFLMDALRPQTEKDILALRRNGSFDAAQIDAYTSLCESEGVSFDLFDKERPFMQSAYIKEWDHDPKPIALIDCTVPSGNNHTHFCHCLEDDYSVTVDKAARLLLTFQQFCTVGIHEYRPGVNGTPPYFGVVKRPTLFETLIFTLLPIEQIPIPFDTPPVIWRSTEPVYAMAPVESTSWLRGMFFPARRIRLFSPTVEGLIEKINLAQGENYTGSNTWTDPFVTYRTINTERIPLKPNGVKPIWRSMQDILDIEGQHASQLLSQYVRLSGEPYVEMTLYGVQTDKAKYIQLMRHDIRFKTDILWSAEAVFLLKQCIEAAELLANKLRYSIAHISGVHVSRKETAARKFYAMAEQHFWKLCDNAASDEAVLDQYRTWCETIGKSVVAAFNETLRNIHLRGKSLAQAADQQRWLEYEVYKLLHPKEEKKRK